MYVDRAGSRNYRAPSEFNMDKNWGPVYAKKALKNRPNQLPNVKKKIKATINIRLIDKIFEFVTKIYKIITCTI